MNRRLRISAYLVTFGTACLGFGAGNSQPHNPALAFAWISVGLLLVLAAYVLGCTVKSRLQRHAAAVGGPAFALIALDRGEDREPGKARFAVAVIQNEAKLPKDMACAILRDAAQRLERGERASAN